MQCFFPAFKKYFLGRASFIFSGNRICRQYNTLDTPAAKIADSTAFWIHRPACLQTVQHLAVPKWVSLEVDEKCNFLKRT